MAGKKRILLVDDQPKLIKFIEVALKHGGFEVITATSGKKGLEEVRANEPDVMLLDIRMPEMDGFEVLQRLREFTSMPVIAYSATQEFSTRALKCGANAFLAKPFTMERLTEIIRELTG